MSIGADYVIVGAGLTGATIARMLHDAGRDVLVIEARDRVGGNVADVLHRSGIRHNLHGPHYFRTSSARVRDFAQRFAAFYPFAATVMSQVGNELFPWPLHRSTFERFAQTDEMEANEAERSPAATEPANFEEAMLATLPPTIYRTFIQGYSVKQWGARASDLERGLARRIEIRSDGDHRLSRATFQALPEGGFTAWVRTMLAGIELRLATDFHDVRDNVIWRRKLIYTGSIDRFFNYQFGKLPYRAQNRLNLFFPGPRHIYPCGQVNLPLPEEGDHVRTIEWRHMLAPGEGPDAGTLLTLEFPTDAADWNSAEYPIPSDAARQHYRRYAALAGDQRDVVFCGRLGEYRYLDMDQAIARAMRHADRLLGETSG